MACQIITHFSCTFLLRRKGEGAKKHLGENFININIFDLIKFKIQPKVTVQFNAKPTVFYHQLDDEVLCILQQI